MLLEAVWPTAKIDTLKEQTHRGGVFVWVVITCLEINPGNGMTGDEATRGIMRDSPSQLLSKYLMSRDPGTTVDYPLTLPWAYLLVHY